MKKPTATQRIEQAVKNHDFTFDGKEWYVNGKIAIKLILSERARLNRGVRKLRNAPIKNRTVLWPGPIDQLRKPDMRADAARAIYNLACDDLLALWEG